MMYVIPRHDRMALLIENVAGNRRVTLLGVGDPIIPVDEQPLRQLDRVVVQLDKAAIPVRILGARNPCEQVTAVVPKHPGAEEVPLAAIREAYVHPVSAERFPLGRGPW